MFFAFVLDFDAPRAYNFGVRGVSEGLPNSPVLEGGKKMKLLPCDFCKRLSLRLSGVVNCMVCFLFLLAVPAVASFRITRPYPSPPEFINKAYSYARVGYGGGVFTVFGDYDYNHRDSGLLAWGQPFVVRVTPQGLVLDSIPILPTLRKDGWYSQNDDRYLSPYYTP